MEDWYADIVVVGSGGGALCAALYAKDHGRKVVVLEKTDKLGGSTALSGGAVWIPNNPVLQRAGLKDSYEQAETYFSAVLGEAGPSSSPARRKAFLRFGPVAISFLETCGLKFVHCDGWPDYHADMPGAKARGRSIEAKAFNIKRLGAWADRMRRNAMSPMPVYVYEAPVAAFYKTTWKGRLYASRIALRMAQRLVGRQLVTMGTALYGRLLEACVSREIVFKTESAVVDLLRRDERVTGVIVEQQGKRRRVFARQGVILASGGFAHNGEMRSRHGRSADNAEWTLANPGDTGEVIAIAQSHGAAVDLMELAWWIPGSRLPDGTILLNHYDLSKPHCLLVDSSARRFVNEAASYAWIGNEMYRHDQTVSAVPSWAIFDHRLLEKYGWGMGSAASLPHWVACGYMKCADSVEALAQACGLEPRQLARTLESFNANALAGRDPEFGRGENPYNRYFGDPKHRPNPNLGPVDSPPYYAVQIVPTDVGTCGGVLTDENAQVLDDAGEPIMGLYAAGNVSAPIMDRGYLGGGASLGPAITFAYVAARHACENPE